MVRKLERIQKEMGYCELKLEKERRLRKQILYLNSDLEALDRVLEAYPDEIREGAGGAEWGAPFPVDIARRLADRKRGTVYKAELRTFLARATYEVMLGERDMLHRELEVLEERMQSLSSFAGRRNGLVEEKREAFKGMNREQSSRMRKINEDFMKVEREWGSLTEDLLNLDEGLFFLDRNIDYLKAARGFVLSARSSFDTAQWIRSGYWSDLFRHSQIGRVKEMLEGADRNLKLAEKEIICVAGTRVRTEHFRRSLVPFFRTLFDDLFVAGHLDGSLEIARETQDANAKALARVRADRDQLETKQLRTEKSRDEIFVRLGSSGRKLVWQ